MIRRLLSALEGDELPSNRTFGWLGATVIAVVLVASGAVLPADLGPDDIQTEQLVADRDQSLAAYANNEGVMK